MSPDEDHLKRLTFIGQRTIAAGTLELSFRKPASFVFKAGQNINLMVPELAYEDARGPRRTFTIASAPEESELLFATRLSDSGYKRTLPEIEPGAVFEYLGPQGSFLLEDSPHTAVFLAGGIGITPFRSMLAHAVAAGLRHPIWLLYGNARPETSAYHQWFLSLQERASFFHYLPTMTELSDDHPWPGERRWLSAGLALERVKEAAEAIFYLCGPPKMVEALTAQLREKEVPAQRIRSESLWGY